MNAPALFRARPELKDRIAWTSLCPRSTPVSRLSRFGRRYAHERLFIKREDATDGTYGGNKVRNLEFVLGEAMARGKRRILTIAPLGSNFVAALAAQTERLGLTAEVQNFERARNEQIDRHSRFSRAHGVRSTLHQGVLGPVRAAGASLRSFLAEEAFWCAPGGSSVLGALGHVNAALELAEQIRDGELPEPDVLFVGAGTCGTAAGLTAGLRLAGLSTKIVAIRCVDSVVCNRSRIAGLANRVLARLGSSLSVRAGEITLVAPREKSRYAEPLAEAHALIESFHGDEGIWLDTTYTTKVVQAMAEQLRFLRDKTILYWHTFSAAACR
jgi:1-aminocyclopropane-1-carboxylate deaminase/D-cysteine desulfhydrase-like pyridoxal-dependent ACC family enzyme